MPSRKLLGAIAAPAVLTLAGLAPVVGGRPPPTREPVAVRITAWGDDPRTGGAYAHVPPGASDADLDLLGTAVAGRVLFAGELT